jgi:hypothetical protein
MKGTIVMILVILMTTASLSGCYDTNYGRTMKTVSSTKTFEVYQTDAPDGKYWVHTYGTYRSVLFRSWGETDSELKKSYTVQYMVGDEVKTVLIDSTDIRLHLHLTDDNTSMRMTVDCTSYREGETSETLNQRFYDNINSGVQTMHIDGQHVYNLAAGYYLYIFNLYIPRQELCELSNETVVG